MPPSVELPRPRRWRTPIGIGAAAAGVALAIWTGALRRDSQATAPPASAEPTAGKPLSSTPPLSQTTSVSPSVLSEDEKGRVARALASGRMEMPANIAVLRGRRGTAPDAVTPAPAFAPIAPVGTAVTTARPQFSWTPRAAPGIASTYSITVVDERFREVAKSGSLKTTTWTPRQDLPRGRVLAWQVTAKTRDETLVSPAPPHPEARFMVLDAATVARLAKERARLATEPIALGLVLAKAGLFTEADSVFQTALTDERYDRSQVRALLARLRAR